MENSDLLWTAATEGNIEEVTRLIAAGVDVNARASSCPSSTALQIAAGRNSLDMVNMLLAAGADVNATVSESGRTALQAAAGAGCLEMVKLLLDAGADVNALPSLEEGRTALQFAAGGDSSEIVELLLAAGADVNARSAKHCPSALGLAVTHGSLDILKSLLAGGADVHEPATERGEMTVLHLAAWKGSLEMVQLLITAGSRPGQTGYKGQTIFHFLCGAGKHEILRFLLNLGRISEFVRDRDGSSPLHVAAKEGRLDCVDSLIEVGADLDVTDNAGMTPLAIAIRLGMNGVVTRLLEAGASTETLTVDKLAFLLSLAGSVGSGNVISLRGGRSHPTSFKVFEDGIDGANAMVIESWGKTLEKRSFHFLNPALLVPPPPLSSSFVHPEVHLGKGNFAKLEGDRYTCEASGKPTDWAWTTTDPDNVIRLTAGIPTPNQLSEKSFVILTAYFAFTMPYFDLARSVDPNGLATLSNHSTHQIAISWTMKEARDGPDLFNGYFMRSVLYRSTHRVKYLAIPTNAAAFFTLFLDDIHERWLELTGKAMVYISHCRSAQLTSAGADELIIKSLLRANQQWGLLQICLEEHLSKSKQVLGNFNGHEVLYMEFMDADKMENSEKLPAIITLSNKIELIEKECGQAIARLERETKELIGLEFNLVSAFEARRSFDIASRSASLAIQSIGLADKSIKISLGMSEQSLVVSRRSLDLTEQSLKISEQSIILSTAGNSMAMSMKRLSWVTFIFLPLMFASALFGKNVDVLSNNPSWIWYVAFSVTFMVFVILCWILFKYIPIAQWIEDNIGSRLERKAAGASKPFSSGETAAEADLETGIRRRSTYSHTEAQSSSSRRLPGAR